MIYDERGALNRMGLNSFSDMRAEQIPEFIKILPDMDRRSAVNALNDMPAYASMAGQMADCFMDAARRAMESGSETSRAAARTIETAAAALSKQLENSDISWIVRSDINDKLIELSKMQLELNRDNKSFLLKAAGIAGGVVAVLAGAAAYIFGNRKR